MKAMILAAGKGSRLAPLTDKQPKPMLPINKRPLIEWQVMALARAGVSTVVINLHHLGDQISDFLEDGTRYGLAISYSREDELLETGGGILKALPLLNDDCLDTPFWLLNGDIWTDFSFSQLPTTLPKQDLAHLVLTPCPSSRREGDFELTNGRISQRGPTYVYCGIALISPALFAGRQNGHFSIRDLYFDMIDQHLISGQVHKGTWHDIGTLAEYQRLTNQFAASNTTN